MGHGRSYANIAARFKEKRREEAKKRQEKRDKLSDKEQIAKLDMYGFTAKKERARLNSKIAVISVR